MPTVTAPANSENQRPTRASAFAADAMSAWLTASVSMPLVRVENLMTSWIAVSLSSGSVSAWAEVRFSSRSWENPRASSAAPVSLDIAATNSRFTASAPKIGTTSSTPRP